MNDEIREAEQEFESCYLGLVGRDGRPAVSMLPPRAKGDPLLAGELVRDENWAFEVIGGRRPPSFILLLLP